MRYLPILEIEHQIIQVAFPDMHAIGIAESYLTAVGDEREHGFKDCLLTSPMLLFWSFQKWRTDNSDSDQIPITRDELVAALLQLVNEDAQAIVRDNSKPLTSVIRIETNSFLDVACFFESKDESLTSFADQIYERLVLVMHVWSQMRENGEFRLGTIVPQNSFEETNLVDQFEKSDCRQFVARESVKSVWETELSSFRNGFGALDSKLQRLNQLETEFDDLVERAKISAVQQLAYGASHEINNPLANISTRAQALLRDETDPKRRQRLKTIDAQAFRAHDMISNLMTFAKPRRPEVSRFQLRPAVDAAISLLESFANEHQVQIQSEVDSAVYLEADPDHFKDMVFALVENAIESIRQDGTVRIRCELPAQGNPIQIDILDNGPGISPEIRKHIFDPFFSGREAGRGLGFGLSKVWRLMELHHGSIRVTDKNGQTCFELLFPQKQSEIKLADIEKTA